MIHLTLQAELVYPCCVPHTCQRGSEKALMRMRYLGLVAKDERICSPGAPGRCRASRGLAWQRQRRGGFNKLAMGGFNSSASRDSSISAGLLSGQQELEAVCCALITHLYAFHHEMYMDHVSLLRISILLT